MKAIPEKPYGRAEPVSRDRPCTYPRWGGGRFLGHGSVEGFPPFPLLVRPPSGRYLGAIGKLEARRCQTFSTASKLL